MAKPSDNPGDAVLVEILSRIRGGQCSRVVAVVEEGDAAPLMGLLLRLIDARWFAVSPCHAHDLVGYGDPDPLHPAPTPSPERCFSGALPEFLAHPFARRPAPGVLSPILEALAGACN
jgi:hypothetical protein